MKIYSDKIEAERDAATAALTKIWVQEWIQEGIDNINGQCTEYCSGVLLGGSQSSSRIKGRNEKAVSANLIKTKILKLVYKPDESMLYYTIVYDITIQTNVICYKIIYNNIHITE